MRVVSGEYGGRPLKAVSGKNTRPTTDKVKESLFHMIGPYFKGGQVLDLYAGSGALGIEAVSRGMDKAYLVDKDHVAINTIETNIDTTREPDKFVVWKKNDLQALALLSRMNESFDLVLLDPPYATQKLEMIIRQLIKSELLNNHAIIVCETDHDVTLEIDVENVNLIKEKIYGTTKISLYEWVKE